MKAKKNVNLLVIQQNNKICTVKKVKCTVVKALRFCIGCTVHRGSRGIGKGKVHCCTGTEALYRLYGP